MKKAITVVVGVALVVGGFFIIRPGSAPEEPLKVSKARPPAPVVPTPAPSPAAPASARPNKSAPPQPEPAMSWSNPQMTLDQVLGPNNLFHDSLMGVSMTYPEGWTVRAAGRWGQLNGENTVILAPGTQTTAQPAMYYQNYPKDVPNLAAPEDYLRNIAAWKENSRIQAGLSDYKNVPESFEFVRFGDNPAMSYFATFTMRDEVMTEYFIRILGTRGYVMFFTKGKLDDVKALMPQIKQMAGTVKVP